MPQLREVNRREVGVELVAPVEVDVLPSHGRDALEDFGGDQFAAALQLRESFGQDQCVVVNHCVADQPGALVPNLLLMLGVYAAAAAVSTGDGPAQLVVGPPPVIQLRKRS